MALIKCPECGKEIPDKSINCIHCGYPLDLQSSQPVNTEINTIVNEADQLRINSRYTEAIALYEKQGFKDISHTMRFEF